MTDYTAQISAYIEKEREILSCLNICQINAVMNLLEEKPEAVKYASAYASVLLTIYQLFTLMRKKHRVKKIGLSLMTAGAWSNTFDRWLRGYVIDYVGFQTKWLEYENIERTKGETKWNFWKLFLYSLDGILAFSTMPLAFVSVIGLIFCMLAFVLILITVVRTAIFGDPTSGWPSLVCIISLISGVQLLCLGIVGQYMAKMYMEVKNRPIYLIKEEL